MKVIISPCGTKAKTLNPYGERGCICFLSILAAIDECRKKCERHIKWQRAESERKEYELDGETSEYVRMMFIGTELEAELLPNGKIKIID